MKRQIIIGFILVVLGLALLLLLLKGDSQGDYRELQSVASQVSINAPWYNGQIIIEGKSHPLRYRRYDRPLLLTKEFRIQQESTSISPLHTLLSYYSRISRDGGITKKETLDYHSKPQDVLDSIEKYGVPRFNEEADFSGWKILGEIAFKNHTLIISQVPDDRPEPFYIGADIITESGRHLLDPEAKPREIVLQRLSGDQYSLVTGVVLPDYDNGWKAVKNYTIVRDPADTEFNKVSHHSR